MFEMDHETAPGELKLKNLIIKYNKFFEEKEKKTFTTSVVSILPFFYLFSSLLLVYTNNMYT